MLFCVYVLAISICLNIVSQLKFFFANTVNFFADFFLASNIYASTKNILQIYTVSIANYTVMKIYNSYASNFDKCGNQRNIQIRKK